jgi:hypothetical protein
MAKTKVRPAAGLSVDVRGADECWPFLNARDRKGYGRVFHRGKVRWAHRVAWELANGPIPEGMWVLHSCDNPPCCNPAHLRLGTPADNAADRDARGRRRPPRGEANGRAKLSAEDVVDLRRARIRRDQRRDVGLGGTTSAEHKSAAS